MRGATEADIRAGRIRIPRGAAKTAMPPQSCRLVLNLRGHDIYPQLGTDPVLPYGEGPTSPDEPLVPDEEEAPPS